MLGIKGRQPAQASTRGGRSPPSHPVGRCARCKPQRLAGAACLGGEPAAAPLPAGHVPTSVLGRARLRPRHFHGSSEAALPSWLRTFPAADSPPLLRSTRSDGCRGRAARPQVTMSRLWALPAPLPAIEWGAESHRGRESSMHIPRDGSMRAPRLLQPPPEGKSTYCLPCFEHSHHTKDLEML